MATKLEISELDFDGIKDNLKTFLSQQDEFTDYDFEGSGMSVLLDVLAYNTHYLGYNANMLANEMFIDSADLRSSVVSKAKQVGYTPTSTTASTATIDVLVNNEQVSKISDNKQKVSVGANGGVTPLSFIVEFNPKNYGLLDILATLLDTGKGTQITIQGNVSVYSGLLITTKSPVDFTYTLEDFIGSDNDGSQISC